MSVIYMAIAQDAKGVGVTIFKQGAVCSTSPGSIVLGLGKGELLRAGHVPSPCRRRVDVGASVAMALSVKQWFDVGPCVGGACVPEEFIVGSTLAGQWPGFLGARVMAWSIECGESFIADARSSRHGPEWIHEVDGEAMGKLGSLSTGSLKKETTKRLSDEENEIVGAASARGTLEAVAIGLVSLGRWKGADQAHKAMRVHA